MASVCTGIAHYTSKYGKPKLSVPGILLFGGFLFGGAFYALSENRKNYLIGLGKNVENFGFWPKDAADDAPPIAVPEAAVKKAVEPLSRFKYEKLIEGIRGEFSTKETEEFLSALNKAADGKKVSYTKLKPRT